MNTSNFLCFVHMSLFARTKDVNRIYPWCVMDLLNKILAQSARRNNECSLLIHLLKKGDALRRRC